jgi:hypothetical protein
MQPAAAADSAAELRQHPRHISTRNMQERGLAPDPIDTSGKQREAAHISLDNPSEPGGPKLADRKVYADDTKTAPTQ